MIDSIGRHLTTQAVRTTPDGCHRLLDWLRSHGDLIAVGVEGTGAYGSGFARYLHSDSLQLAPACRRRCLCRGAMQSAGSGTARR
ncbi:hypothetical protein ACFYYI_37500 [Streptomyces sp. NPDC002387]|uniref:hypothetical protein n=1 Tax=unclassified Streptomyces TaxID=2593676 RepID=UPI003675747C